MASRTRIISQSKALYVSPTGTLPNCGAGASLLTALAESGVMPAQLHRVDTFSFDIDLAGGRQDVREFGQLARIGTITLGDLNPSFSLGYYLGNAENEGNLGFDALGINPATAALQDQFISGIIDQSPNKREKNLFLSTVAEGKDAFTTAGSVGTASAGGSEGQFIANPTGRYTSGEIVATDVVSFGNCTFNSYTVNFSVGEIPRVDIEGNAENITFNTSCSGLYNPSLARDGSRADTGQLMLGVPSTGLMDVLVLRPEDVTLSFDNPTMEVGGTNYGNMHVQSASIEVPLSRTPIEALGSAKAVAQPLDFPINVTLTINALLKQFDAGQLDLMLTGNAGNETTNVTLNVNGEDGQSKHIYKLQKAVLDSQGFSTTLDDNESIDLVFSTQIGGVGQTDAGFFYSGDSGLQPDRYSTTVGNTNEQFHAGFYYPKLNELAPYNAGGTA